MYNQNIIGIVNGVIRNGNGNDQDGDAFELNSSWFPTTGVPQQAPYLCIRWNTGCALTKVIPYLCGHIIIANIEL